MAMAKLRSASMLFCLVGVATASAIPEGIFKATDAYCTKDSYVYTQDELNYIRSVRGEGSCTTGDYRDFPCYEDYYVFGPGKNAKVITRITDRSKASCVMRTDATFTEDQFGFISLVLGKTESEVMSPNPDVSISCEMNSDDSSNTMSLQYRIKGDKVLLVQSSDDKCGDFLIEYSLVEKAP